MTNFSEIHTLNSKKEYLLLDAYIHDAIHTTNVLKGMSRDLWFILYNQAKFDAELKVMVPNCYLGSKLNKSSRTITRYITNLVDAGFLNVIKNHRPNGSRTANTYQIIVPKELLNEAKLRKDRLAPVESYIENEKRPSNFDDMEYEECFESSNNSLEGIRLTNKAYEKPRGARSATPPDKTVRTNIKYNNNYIHTNNKQTNVVKNLNKEEEGFDEQVRSLKDKTVNLQTKINENKAKLARLEAKKNKISPYNQCLKDIKGNLQGALKQIQKNKIPEPTEKYKQLSNEIININNQIVIMEHELSICVKKLNMRQKETVIYSDPMYINNKSGGRVLDSRQVSRLITKIRGCGYSEATANRLTNELVFEARFGSLSTNNVTKRENPLERSLNIGLKLMREGRWSTPNNLTI